MATILVVDDSTTDRELVASALEGHTVIEAMSGEEGIGKVREFHPDLVIMDVVMPGKNGFQTCRELRKTPEGATIPIIMLTSKNQRTDREWGMRQGASDYLTKPFADEDLVGMVSRYLA